MALKFAEVLLGLKFRQINPDGTVDGGPMYYIQNGLKIIRFSENSLLIFQKFMHFAVFLQ